jgi:type II secretory pathway pseudopilin PulG
MKLHGQRGYAMVALIVGMSIMAVMMTAVLPSWSQMARREKEAELVFRGEQYARAIGLFQRRSGPGVLPPSIDVLVDQKFLRKKYKDPITNDDFALVSALTPAPGATPAGRNGTPQQGFVTQRQTTSPPATGGGAPGGIMGVASKSTAESLRTYKGRTRYNEWQFVYIAQTQAPGLPAGPGGRGARGRGPGNGGGPGVPIGPGSQERGVGPGGPFRGGGPAGGSGARGQAPDAPPQIPQRGR